MNFAAFAIRFLQFGAGGNILLFKSIPRVGPSAQHPRVGAWGVEQNAVEEGREPALFELSGEGAGYEVGSDGMGFYKIYFG